MTGAPIIVPAIASVVLAAGFGTRMKSRKPKVLHEILGRPMIDWAVDAAASVSAQAPVVVVGHGRDMVEAQLGDRAAYAVQDRLLGTGHAVLQAAPLLRETADAVVVTYGDMPLLRPETLQSLVALFHAEQVRSNPAIAMLTVVREDPQGFGRIVRDEQGAVCAIVEEVDCTPEQREIKELNPGVYCFDAAWLWEALAQIPISAKGEYYLTDAVALAVEQGRSVVSLPASIDDVYGVNTRVHLAEATGIARARVLEAHMLEGVTIVDPNTTWIDVDVTIGTDTTVWPGSILHGKTTIGEECTIGPNATVVDSVIGNGCAIRASVVEEAVMEEECEIGPFGHLRKGAHLARGVHMGNFGEVKNSYLGPGVKMGHFSYLGDAQVGADVNIGAGTVTCNYDGQSKHPTVIGAGAFIGSDTMLVAPVTIGPGAKIGAGSVVTKDVDAADVVYGVPARPQSTQKG